MASRGRAVCAGGLCVAALVGCAKRAAPHTEAPATTGTLARAAQGPRLAASSSASAADSAALGRVTVTSAVSGLAKPLCADTLNRPTRVTASSTFSGSSENNAHDANLRTSWYSARGDSAANGKAPFVELEFDEPRSVRRVRVFGNRDQEYTKGYGIHAGKVELFDANRSVLAVQTGAGTGEQYDFDVTLPKQVSGVKRVRFTSVEDEGKRNQYGSVGISELQVESSLNGGS